MGDTSTASDNGQDDDCDGLVDDADEDCLPCDEDADGDGFTDASCSGGGDCDDTSAEIHPFAFEGTARCFDGLDNDCDGAVDADDPGCTAEGICSVDGWCWENPLPQGNWLSGIHAFADDDVWAVGDVGTVLRWDGEAWSALDTGSREHLFGIWGSGPDDVWVSGAGGALLHYDGASWSGQAGESFAEALRAIWGSDPNNIWVGGDEGAMRRFDGETWTPVPFPGRGTVHDIWGSGPDDVWAVGGIDTCSPCVTRWFIAHFDGEAWSLHDHGQSDGLGGFMLTGIAGSAPDHVITVGRDGVAWRFDGGAWLAERSDSGLELSGVEVTPDGSAIAVGSRGVVARYDAGTEAWSTLRAAEQGAAWLSGAGALPSGDVWLVGARGAILRARRGALEEISHDAARGGTLRGIWGFDDEAAWAVGDGGALLRREGQRWSAVEVEGAPSLRAIWGSSPQDIWVGGGALLHFDGEAWRPFEGERPEGAVDAWGVSLDDAWMLTERALWRWDGEA
ncbi:hypothetical protein KKF91_22015, partial [Myxococcota bacterium]|nr:hypothetical protein [Myxococcota bacterium]